MVPRAVEGRASEGGRVFVIRAQQTDERLWPDFLRDARGHALIGFPFYDPENGDPWGFQLREPGDEYFKELTRLRTWLTKRLRELRERAAKTRGGRSRRRCARGAATPTGPRLIYLHAPFGSESERADVDIALKTDGIVPLTAPSRSAGGKPRRTGSAKPRSGSTWQAMRSAHAAARRATAGRFVGDLLGIGVEERKEIVRRARRAAALRGARQDRREPADRRGAVRHRAFRRQSDATGAASSALGSISARGAGGEAAQ